MNNVTNPLQPTPRRILSIKKHTGVEYTFRLETDTVPRYGQFYMLSLPRVGEAPISVSGQGEGYVEFTIRNTGVVTRALFELVPGNSIFLRGPYGSSFPVEQFEGKHLLVVCGGTGMSPVLTMLNHFAEHPEKAKSVHLITGFKDPSSILFRDEIERYRRSFHVIATLDSGECPGFETGLVTVHIPKIPIADWGEDYNIVVVGAPGLMKFGGLACLRQGAKPERMWISLARKMSCGQGKCGHCKICGTYVCLEGPVFNFADVKDKLLD